MTEPEIVVGTTVELKSGSPRMTVTHVSDRLAGGGTEVDVEWFDGGTLSSASFPVDTLRVVTDCQGSN